MTPAPHLVDRFRADLDGLVPADARLGIAVSGGPDSLALLLLAAAARPGLVESATVDHGLRSESADEAAAVAALCAELGVPHATLTPAWSEPPTANLQARAREARYAALGAWAVERGLAAVATAHHCDDQAETVLMRLARGAGVGGLVGIQPTRPLAGPGGHSTLLVRPLLSWRREELGDMVRAAGVRPADDPSNRDERFDRSRARALLGGTAWLDPVRLAAVAANAADAEDALQRFAGAAAGERIADEGDGVSLDASGLPREIQRRLLLAAIGRIGAQTPPGPQLMDALDTLLSGGVTTLCGLKLDGRNARWRINSAPARRC